MKVFELLSKIPRQIIFICIGLAIIIPLIVPIGIPVNVMPQSEKLFNAIDSLGPESKPVLISCDFDPQAEPELYPMLLAILRHCFARNIKVMIMALWPQGTGMAEMALADLSDEFDIMNGKNYTFLGYKVGGAAVCLGLGESIWDVFPNDYYNTPLDSLEMMADVKNYDNVSLVITISSGDPGFRTWVIYAQSRYGATIGTGITAVSAADTYHFLETGQLIGLLAGMKGASEYEVMVTKAGYSNEQRRAAQGMDAQSLGHLLIMVFIIVGNIGYFAIRRKK
jgi:hypothetical protein